MLDERFYEVWFVGDLDEDGVKKLRESLFDALKKGEKRMRLRFYLTERNDLSYLGELRGVFLENTRLTVVIESRGLGRLEEDVKTAEKDVLIVVNKIAALPSTLHSEKLRIVKVGGNG
ncbi:MAG: hypothetical protein J7L83_03560 [Thaumarchaeota archaeon]|nr:hypothetical protein [Nitrososphaerota archaeon]